MKQVKIFHDRTGNTLTIWFGNPQEEYVCEETGFAYVVSGASRLERYGGRQGPWSEPEDVVQSLEWAHRHQSRDAGALVHRV